MDTILEADNYRVFICGGMTGKVTHSSEQYSFLFLKIVSIIDVRLETVEIGLRPCSWLRVKSDFIHILWLVKTVRAVTLVVNIFVLSVKISSRLWIQRYIHKNVRSLIVERYMFYIKMYFCLIYARRNIIHVQK